MKRANLSLGALLLMISSPGFACWQNEQPTVLISTNLLSARITNNDRPLRRMKIQLHTATTFSREEARSMGAYEKRILRSATSDAKGVLSFGQVSPGKYWLVPVGSRSLSESIAVEVIAAESRETEQRLWVKFLVTVAAILRLKACIDMSRTECRQEDFPIIS